MKNDENELENTDETVEINLEDVMSAGKSETESADAAAVEDLVDSLDEQEPVVVANEIDELKKEIALQKDKYVRLMAEFDNYKRRSAREYEKLVASANKGLMVDIIDIRNNFERALGVADEKSDFSEFLKGMQLIFSKFDENLSKNGLTVFAEVGEAFNPELHDAMMQMPSGDVEKGLIMQIFEKGYSLNGSVIRHAKVVVSSGPAE